MVMGKAEVWCDECASTQLAKVLGTTPGYTKITAAECLTCGTRFELQVGALGPDQGEHQDHDADHTPVEIDAEG
jgi:hypothetical protein